MILLHCREGIMTSKGRIGGIYKPLTDQEIETIHSKALDILEQVGVEYEENLEALDMLLDAGCNIDAEARKILKPFHTRWSNVILL